MKPTLAQEEYAQSLVERLRAAYHFSTELYGRKVLACQDRAEMSRLIDAMKDELLDDEGWPS